MSEGAFYDVRDVKGAARGRWVDVLSRLGIDGGKLRNVHGPCPGCGGKDRFRFDDVAGEGSFICSQGGGGILAGDGFALLEHVLGWEWKRCVQEVGALLGVAPRRGMAPGRSEEGKDVAPAPVEELVRVPELDMGKVEEFVRGTCFVDEGWLGRRSPVDVSGCTALDFLGHVLGEDERVLVFVDEHSQGDFAVWKRGGELGGAGKVESFRLSQQRGVKAVRSGLPGGGPKGVWWLTNPVTGQWAINPRSKGDGGKDEPKWSRRSMESVTGWRHLVLESDVLPWEVWLRVVVNLEVRIVAIYTSGGRSIHVLVRVDAGSKGEWDAIRDMARQLFCPLGADGGAMSGVRLSRLPGCLRGKNAQRLLYLNPEPTGKKLRLMLERRG